MSLLLKDLIRDYLIEAKMMQLATVGNDGKPWVCNVWFAADKSLNIYWFSATTRRHSEELMKTPHVAAAICLPQTPADKPRGLQLEGTAELLTSPADITKAMEFYADRIFSPEKIEELMAHADRPHRFYKITAENYVLFDAVNYPEAPRQELKI